VIACRWCLFLVLAAACGGSDATSVRVRVQFDPGWGLDRLSVQAGGREEEASVDDTVTLLVPDAWAGEAVAIQVSGMRGDQVSAQGEAEAVPERGKAIEIDVALALVPCTDECPDCPSCELCGGDPCEEPPAPSCVDDTTVRVHDSPGTCDGQTCQYEPRDMPCPTGCKDGACNGVVFDAGSFFNCAVLEDGAPACWGRDELGKTTPAAGALSSISAGSEHACGLRVDGTAVCWGNDEDDQAGALDGTFSSVSAGGIHTCAIQIDGTALCWGNDEYGQASPPEGTFSQLSAGSRFNCGVKSNGTVDCWGYNAHGQSTPPVGAFAAVSAGSTHACGLGTDGTIACWGSELDGQIDAPVGTFSSLSVGSFHSCAVSSEGTVICWGSAVPELLEAPEGVYTSVSAGAYHTCALRADGALICWGDDEFDYGQFTPPF
jgi:Regulator of chromosome condensation (RCC1) repeat